MSTDSQTEKVLFDEHGDVPQLGIGRVVLQLILKSVDLERERCARIAEETSYGSETNPEALASLIAQRIRSGE